MHLRKFEIVVDTDEVLEYFLYFMTAINGLMNLDVLIVKLRLGEFMNHIAPNRRKL